MSIPFSFGEAQPGQGLHPLTPHSRRVDTCPHQHPLCSVLDLASCGYEDTHFSHGLSCSSQNGFCYSFLACSFVSSTGERAHVQSPLPTPLPHTTEGPRKVTPFSRQRCSHFPRSLAALCDVLAQQKPAKRPGQPCWSQKTTPRKGREQEDEACYQQEAESHCMCPFR